jgi:hypothetical protein
VIVRPHHSLALPALLLLAAANCPGGEILYQQAPTIGGYTAWGSQATPSGLFARAYDNFTLGAHGLVGEVSWQGIYIDESDPAANPATPNTTSFEISFWSDLGGQPGTLLAASTISLTQANPASLGLYGFNFPSGSASARWAWPGWAAVAKSRTGSRLISVTRRGSGGRDGLAQRAETIPNINDCL